MFLSGKIQERTFDGVRTFGAGDFVFRPSYFAHADEAGSRDARFVRLPVSKSAARRWFDRHGWRAAHGRIDPRQRLDSDALLADATPDPYVAVSTSSPMERAADGLARGRSAGDVAEELNLAPHQFTRRFAATFDVSPTKYRRHARLQTALRLLSESTESAALIAAAAGFHDQSHLTRELVRATSCTPTRWRAAL